MMINVATYHLFNLPIKSLSLTVCLGVIGRRGTKLYTKLVKEGAPEVAHKHGVSIGYDLVWEAVISIDVFKEYVGNNRCGVVLGERCQSKLLGKAVDGGENPHVTATGLG